jgi:hypothetical protein
MFITAVQLVKLQIHGSVIPTRTDSRTGRIWSCTGWG